MKYKPYFEIESQNRTCHYNYKIGNITSGQDKLQCERRCDDNQQCRFFFHTITDCCALYTSCDQDTATDKAGTTYEKGILTLSVNQYLSKIIYIYNCIISDK